MKTEIANMQVKLDKATSMVQNKGATEAEILEYLGSLDAGYHQNLEKWDKWFYEGNHPNIPPYMIPKQFNPEHDYADMVSQEIRDVEKQMSWIRQLEKKLKGKDQNEYGNTHDWEMLSRLKKDLNLDVGFKTSTEK